MDTDRFFRRVRSRPFFFRLAAVATVLLVASTLVGLATGPRPGPSGSVPPIAEASPSTPDSTTATPTEGVWAAVTLPPSGVLADITPTRLIGRAVATNAAFTLQRRGSIAAADLASHVTAQPPIAFDVQPGKTADTVTLVPGAALAPGTRYRLALAAPDGSLAGTWTFRTSSPLHVVARLPDDRTTEVPLNTGIEVTFDQDSPVGVAAHFTISPAVTGRFEQHGRTTAFVPTKPLKAGTLYTVTVTHGVQLSGSDEVLETDVKWQFATALSAAEASGGPSFSRPVVEVRTGQVPTLLVHAATNEDGVVTQSSSPYDVYRLTFDGATRIATTLLATPEWAGSVTSAISTSGLTRVATGTAPMTNLGQYSGLVALRLPVLDPGWYLVVLPTGPHPAQLVLQVTDLAAYVMTTQTRTVAWVSDLATQGPIVDAAIAIAGGSSLGRTDARGLLVTATPTTFIDPWTGGDDDRTWPPHLITVAAPDGRQLIAPLGMTGLGYPRNADARLDQADATNSYWLLLTTDRGRYRQTDTVHAWGVVRDRDDGSIPGSLSLQLAVQGQRVAPIAKVAIQPTSAGVFTVDVPIRDLPAGSYDVGLYAGSRLLQSTWIEVGTIRKPAYVVSVETDHRAYFVGDKIVFSGSLSFYDGSRVPGMAVVGSTDENASVQALAGADGRFSGSLVARWPSDDPRNSWRSASVVVAPASPEEGTISGETEVMIFPAAVWLDGEASVVNGRLTMTATLSGIDRAALDAGVDGGDPFHPVGPPLPGKSVTVRVIHHIPIRTQIGTSYDFITKRVVPMYKYDSRDETVLSRALITDSSGAIKLDVAVPAATDSYSVELGASDAQGRQTSARVWPAWNDPRESNPGPYLVSPYSCGSTQVTAALGSTPDLTIREGDHSVASPGQYLFLVGRRGLTDVVLQTSSTLDRPFTRADLPNVEVTAVRLTPRGYELSGTAEVVVDRPSKTVAVSVTPLQTRYAPGATASVEIRTLGPDGRSVAAEVVVRAVDEKLYTMGAADEVDALGELMRPVASGFLQSYASHPTPYSSGDGCGGTGGRSDFADAATFQRVRTGSDGRVVVSFHLPDDLTGWHVSATAITDDLDAGTGTAIVPVGLPFFVDAILAPEYLAGDVPAIVARAYGDGVTVGTAVRFVVSAPELGVSGLGLDGRVGTAIRIPLPALSAGDHEFRIEATAGRFSDAVIRTVHVVPTRLQALRITQKTLDGGAVPGDGTGLTTYVVSDAGRGSLLPVLQRILGGDGARFDQSAAADLARQLLIDEFSVPASNLPPSSFDADRYNRSGVALLPYASPDLALTALAAVATPTRIDQTAARDALAAWLAKGQTRERTIIALAGQAALGEDVLDRLSGYGQGLTLREQIWLGIAYLVSGDENHAREIERQILQANGQQLDTWVRLDAGPDLESTLEATALQLILSGGVGDPLATGMARYLLSQPAQEHVFSLELAAYAQSGLDRLPRTAASFAWTLDGRRQARELAPGESFSLTVTRGQRAGLTFERIAGDPVLTATWSGDATAASLPATPGIDISRTVTPGGDTPADRVVRVTIAVSFGPKLPEDCYEVTDLLPSGLAPLVNVPDWPDDPATQVSGLWPYSAEGQHVSWCVTPSASIRTFQLVYSARVVNPGTYRWEPAVVQSTAAASLGAATTETTYTIR